MMALALNYFTDCETFHRVRSWYVFEIIIFINEINARFSLKSFKPFMQVEKLLILGAHNLLCEKELFEIIIISFYNDFSYDTQT